MGGGGAPFGRAATSLSGLIACHVELCGLFVDLGGRWRHKTYALFLLLFTVVSAYSGKGLTVEADGKTLHGATPKMSEEESMSQAMPKQHVCNGCLAAAFQLSQGLRRMYPSISESTKHSKKKQKPAPEWELEDIYDEVCEGSARKTWDSYGIQEQDGVPTLIGEGLPQQPAEAGDFTVTTTGGLWAVRLKAACFKIVEEVGARPLYDKFIGGHGDVDAARLCVEIGHCTEDTAQGTRAKAEKFIEDTTRIKKEDRKRNKKKKQVGRRSAAQAEGTADAEL